MAGTMTEEVRRSVHHAETMTRRATSVTRGAGCCLPYDAPRRSPATPTPCPPPNDPPNDPAPDQTPADPAGPLVVFGAGPGEAAVPSSPSPAASLSSRWGSPAASRGKSAFSSWQAGQPAARSHTGDGGFCLNPLPPDVSNENTLLTTPLTQSEDTPFFFKFGQFTLVCIFGTEETLSND